MIATRTNDSVDTKKSKLDNLVTTPETIGFIRVRKRTLKLGTSMSFDVVRAVRVKGKPRHQFILGLGSQKSLYGSGCFDLHFWACAIGRMERHGLSELQRRRLAAEMIRKGARLPPIEQCKAAIGWNQGWLPVVKEIAIIRGTP